MLFKNLQTSVVLAVASIFLVFSGCDIFGSDESNPKVDDVVVVGTQVKSDFQETGEFGLTATPLDQGGDAILKKNVKAEIELQHESATQGTQIEAHNLDATITIDTKNKPSNNNLVASISMDGSGSMGGSFGSDPNRLRVDGAKAFFDELMDSGNNFEAGIFEFPGTAPNFQYNSILQDYTGDVDSLKTASEQVTSGGGTPMYSALGELLTYSESVRPASKNDKAIVLFADGQPNTTSERDSVCAQAERLKSPIYGIGLGPASDLSDDAQGAAIAEMRYISSCHPAGAYQGLVKDSLEVIEEAFKAVATGSSKGSVGMSVKIQSGLDEVQAGGVVQGSVTIESGGETASGDFSFRVPASSSTTTMFEFE